MAALILKIGDKYSKHYFAGDDVSGLSLGRAFTNDIIIDDPYVGETQLQITASTKDGFDWNATITDHTNPVFVNKNILERRDVDLRSGDVISVGRTSIAFYNEAHAVPATREFSFTNWLQNHKFKPYISLLCLVILFGVAILLGYLGTSSKPNWGDLSYAAYGTVITALLWAAGWSLAGRLLKGESYFFSQLFFTSLCLALILSVSNLGDYVDYIFASQIAGKVVDWFTGLALGGLLLGLNLTLVSNSPRIIRKGVLINACIAGAVAFMVYLGQPDYSNRPSHSITIKPSFIPTISAISIGQYITSYNELFSSLSTMKPE
jgi:ribosome-associated protein YbcJ (S4-like RNA binding protein)